MGHFNDHLRDAVVVFADEAFFPGDKQGEGTLKMLITEPIIPIEGKGQNVVFVTNMIHLFLASNHEWVVPAGLDERRFCVLDVSDAHQEDHPYFEAILQQMDQGGLAGLLYDLQRHESDVNLRHVPVTTALIEQKRLSMSPHERWWFEKLWSGQLLPDHQGWEPEVLKAALHDDYTQTLGKIGTKRKATETELGIFVKKMLPPGGLGTCRKMATVPDTLGRAHEGQRKSLWHWRLPSLSICRDAFNQLSRTVHDWPDDPEGGDE